MASFSEEQKAVFDDEMLKIKRSLVVYRNMRDRDLLKYYYKMKTIDLVEKDQLSGSSPPEIFIGSYGYPNVFIGPMIPPVFGDTSVMSTPELWADASIPKIVEYRSMLVRGMYRTNVRNVEKGKIEDLVKEFAIADKYVDSEAKFYRKPNLRLSFDDNSQPFGPSAPLKEIRTGEIKADRDLERLYGDTDATATEAILELYKGGVKVSRIQKALSAGILGIGRNRRFVPTRWSITAVDDTISKANLSVSKTYDPIEQVTVYENVALDNRWLIMMFPGNWSYELVEAWYPKTTWNPDGKEVAIYSSNEPFKGRSTYAEIGGCYYAARLAVSELFERIKRQATVVILRETHPGYILPVGVWNVREHVRQALLIKPLTFDSINDAFDYVTKKMDLPLGVWISNSRLLREIRSQRRL